MVEKWYLLGCLKLKFFSVVVGTTCATVLTRAILIEGVRSVGVGMNAMDLRRGMTMAVDAVVTYLKSRARMISTSEEIAQVCDEIFWCILYPNIFNHRSGLTNFFSWMFCRWVPSQQMVREKLGSWLQRLWKRLERKE